VPDIAPMAVELPITARAANGTFELWNNIAYIGLSSFGAQLIPADARNAVGKLNSRRHHEIN